MLINKTAGVCFDEILSKSYSVDNVGTKPIESLDPEYSFVYEKEYFDNDPNLGNLNMNLSIYEAYLQMNSIPPKIKVKLLKR